MSSGPEVTTEEIARVLRLYEGPALPQAVDRAGSRHAPVRPVLAILVLVVAAVSAAAVIGFVTGSGRDRTHNAIAPTGCTSTLTWSGTPYVARAVTPGQMQVGRSLGNGVLRLCGAPPATTRATTLAGIDARRAVGVRGVRGLIYVGPSCARATSARLLHCLRTKP